MWLLWLFLRGCPTQHSRPPARPKGTKNHSLGSCELAGYHGLAPPSCSLCLDFGGRDAEAADQVFSSDSESRRHSGFPTPARPPCCSTMAGQHQPAAPTRCRCWEACGPGGTHGGTPGAASALLAWPGVLPVPGHRSCAGELYPVN